MCVFMSKIHSRQEDGSETNIINQVLQHADTMTFPISYPHGNLDWTYIMLSKKDKKLTLLK